MPAGEKEEAVRSRTTRIKTFKKFTAVFQTLKKVPQLAKECGHLWNTIMKTYSFTSLHQCFLREIQRSCRASRSFKVLGGRETMFLHPVVRHELRHVVARGVRQEHHHLGILAQLHLPDEVHRTAHRRPAGAADEHALVADERARELEGLRVVDLAPVVDALLVQHGRDEVVPNALNLV